MKKTTSKHVKGTTVTLEVLDHFKESLWTAEERFIVLSGGAGSGKSHAICQRICAMFMEMEDTQFAIVRGTMPALKRSVYLGDPSIIGMLSSWGVPTDKWLNKSDAMITNPINRNQLRFIGLADPERIKSANYNYVWVEEATELNVTKWRQLDTRMRRYNSNGPNQMFISYNPISYYNWAVQTFVMSPGELKDKIHTNFSNFTQNHYVRQEDVVSWIASAKVDENYYRTYITGEPGMPLGQIYPNIGFSPHQTWHPDVWEQTPYYGVDWGYIDAMTLVECRDYGGKIYARCLYYKTRRDTDDLVAFMKSRKINLGAAIYCDYASPERIQRFIEAGFDNSRKANKEVSAGISHVRTKMIVGSNSGTNGEMFAKEVAGYAYKQDPNDSSKFIESPEEGNEHILDALRYAIVSNDRSGEYSIGALELTDFDDVITGFSKNKNENKEFEGIN